MLLLGGLAILGVVCHHATGWGYTAMFWWTDCYRPVTTPCFDQLGSVSYYALLSIQQLTVFSVPGFLFVSGFFVAYAARGKRASLDWKVVITRIKNLLAPYAIWSGMIFVGEALQGLTYAPIEYLDKLVFGKATPAYFYVPLICQFYLLSPLVAPIAKARGKLVLVVSALLQLGIISLGYLVVFGVKAPTLALMVRITPLWSFPKWTFFFALGVVSGFHVARFKQWLARFKRGLLVAVVVLGLLAVLEPVAIYRITGKDWSSLRSISSNMYAVIFVLCFLAFDKIAVPGSKIIHRLGKNSLGIYLLHPRLNEFVARVIRQIAPWILAHQVIFQPLLVLMGIGIPLLFMTAVSKSPARKYFRYLFG